MVIKRGQQQQQEDQEKKQEPQQRPQHLLFPGSPQARQQVTRQRWEPPMRPRHYLLANPHSRRRQQQQGPKTYPHQHPQPQLQRPPQYYNLRTPHRRQTEEALLYSDYLRNGKAGAPTTLVVAPPPSPAPPSPAATDMLCPTHLNFLLVEDGCTFGRTPSFRRRQSILPNVHRTLNEIPPTTQTREIGCDNSRHGELDGASLSINSYSEQANIDSVGKWTLQTFMDQPLHASHLNGVTPKGKRIGNRSCPKRRLSLLTARPDAPIPFLNPSGRDGDDIRAGDNPTGGANNRTNTDPSILILRDSTRWKRRNPLRRRLFKLSLVSVSITLVALCGAFLLSTNKISLTDFFSRRRGQGESNETDDGKDWHPLFQHGERTADVEMKVPNRPSCAKPISQRVAQDPATRGPVDARTRGTGPDRRAQEAQAAADGYIKDSDSGKDHGGFIMGEPEFVQVVEGGGVQDLCPATHTLISQSLILRSSYGNIFSITTPDKPSKKSNSGRAFTRDKRIHSEGNVSRDKNTHTGTKINRAGVNAAESGTRRGRAEDRKLQQDYTNDGVPSYVDNGDYSNIDTSTESIYTGLGVETITITTLSLRMADFRPNEDTHFEVWLYTGSGDDVVLNSNDLDDDPTNDNIVIPSKGEYQTSRAKFTDWVLIAEGKEGELLLDRDFYDHNGHVFNIGTGNSVGPLGGLARYENMEDVTLEAKKWNKEKLRGDGGMDAVTAEGEVTTTFFYKIPEEKFMPLKLPKYDGKLTLFITLDRVGLQYGYAAKQEFNGVDVTKHDYIDQTPSLDVLNGNVDMRMHVGEGVIFYPWMEEEFFYQTRRFLGKIWYEASIPCEYVPVAEVLEVESMAPSLSPTVGNTKIPSLMPSLAPSENGAVVVADLLVSVLIKDGLLPPMPDDVMKVFEETLLNFVDDQFGEFCPLTWKETATVMDQDLSDIGGLPTGSSSTGRRRRKRDVDNGKGGVTGHQPDRDGKIRHLRQFSKFLGLDSIPKNDAQPRLLQAITLLDVTTVVDALYSDNICPDKSLDELTTLIEGFINNNNKEFLDKLKAADDYFKDAFGVSADVIGAPAELKAVVIKEKKEKDNLGQIIGGILAAVVVLCCCCLPILVIRRRRRKESQENEIIGEDIEWARPVDQDHFPPLGGYRDDLDAVDSVAAGSRDDKIKRLKRPDGDFHERMPSPPPIGLKPIPPGIRLSEDNTEMVHSHRFLDRDIPEDDKKTRPFGIPGRLPGEEDEEPLPHGIKIYPDGDVQEDIGDLEGLDLRHIEKREVFKNDEDWKPDHFEPDGGVHVYNRPQRQNSIRSSWDRLPQKETPQEEAKKKLSIKQLVLQRKKDLEAKKTAMRHVEELEKGELPQEEELFFPKDEPDSRIEDLMTRIKDLEADRTKKYQRSAQVTEESDYERWKRLNVEAAELSSSEESEEEEVILKEVKKKKKKKKKQEANDYMLKFEDLDAYNRALAVHQDAYIHKWVKVKVEKEEGDEGANLDDIDMTSNQGSSGKGEEVDLEAVFISDLGGANNEVITKGGNKDVGGEVGDLCADVEERAMAMVGEASPIEDSNDADMPDDDKDVDAIKNEIVLLVGHVLPEQMEFIDDLLAQFEGREAALRDTLRAKAKREADAAEGAE